MVRCVLNEPVRIVVNIEPGEPVCGTAGRDGGPQLPFEGMLAFLSLLERLREGDGDVDRPPLARI
jgi:hypothetical protein